MALAERFLVEQRPALAPGWMLDQPATTWLLAIVATLWLLLVIWLNLSLALLVTPLRFGGGSGLTVRRRRGRATGVLAAIVLRLRGVSVGRVPIVAVTRSSTSPMYGLSSGSPPPMPKCSGRIS